MGNAKTAVRSGGRFFISDFRAEIDHGPGCSDHQRVDSKIHIEQLVG
jgi:hypothetical protein